MTIGDKIRAMTDEELAKMLHFVGGYVEQGNPKIEFWIDGERYNIDDEICFIKETLEEETRNRR